MSVQTHVTPNTYSGQRPGRKNVWSFDSLVADPHAPFHVYAIQILEGHFDEGSSKMVPADKHKTRVIYAKMDENGKLENVFPGGAE